MVADMWGGVWIVLFRMSYSHWVFVVMHAPYCQKFTECDELVAALGRKLHAMYRTTADDEGPPAQPPTDGVAHTLCAAVTAPLLQSLAPTSGGAGVTPVADTTAAPLAPAPMKHGATADGAAAAAATPTQAALASGGAIVGAVLESSSALLAAGWSSAVSAVTMVGATVAGAPTATPTAGAASDGVVVAAADSSGVVPSDAGGRDGAVADAQAEASCNPEAESNDHSGVGAGANAGAGAGAGDGDGTDAGVAADSDGADGADAAAGDAHASDGTAATPAPHIGAQVGAAIWAAADVGSAALGGVMGAAAAALANTVGRASVTTAPGAVSAEHQHAAWLLLSVVDAPTAGRTSAGTAGDGSASTSTDDTPAAVGSAPSPPAFVKFSSLACAMTVLAQGMHEVAMTRME